MKVLYLTDNLISFRILPHPLVLVHCTNMIFPGVNFNIMNLQNLKKVYISKKYPFLFYQNSLEISNIKQSNQNGYLKLHETIPYRQA